MFPGAQIRVTDNKSVHADERYEDVSALKNLEHLTREKDEIIAIVHIIFHILSIYYLYN